MLKDNFCSSPWFHMRITNNGGMNYCRWSDKTQTQANIKDTSPVKFFQQEMALVRNTMLNGTAPLGCSQCHLMEQHSKISGRQKQLLKVGVRLEQFEKTMLSSPWLKEFTNGPETSQLPQDWQIDLGNYCNSACVFCSPHSSSRLATEFKKIGILSTDPLPNWTDNPELVQRFIETLIASPHIQYLHFIGGETLITPAFKIILEALISKGLNKTATLGFTTNLTVWDSQIVDLLTQFAGLNLGVSIESFDSINEYVRWPASMTVVNENLAKWKKIANQHNWLIQLRTTPTILTIDSLLSVYDYAWDNGIVIESCNFLSQPKFMKPSVMPLSKRLDIIKKMESWLITHTSDNTEIVVNIRNPTFVKDQIIQDLQSYISYLKNEPDESHLLPELILFLKKLENNRGNKITNYLPDYEELFRTAGY